MNTEEEMTMNLNKSLEFFDPDQIKGPCHIVGCGAIGGCIAELLARQGVKDIHLWDFDIVASHNIVNQIYTEEDINRPKVEALKKQLRKINSNIKVTTHEQGWENNIINNYMFLCLDNIETRKKVLLYNKDNQQLKLVTDCRMTLTQGQCYTAKWDNPIEKNSLLDSMNFTHEEAMAETPVSACGFTLSVAPTVRIITSYAIANFMKYINNKEDKMFKKLIISDPFRAELTAV